MQEIEQIRALIGQTKQKEAIEVLLAMKTQYNDTVILLKNRRIDLKDRELNGVVSSADARVERNSINLALLTILKDLEKMGSSKADVAIGVADQEMLEKIIDKNGLKQVSWLAEGLEKAKSVCKIHTPDDFIGTGFLVKGGFIFTNNHVIGSASVAQFSKVEFGYQSSDNDSVFYELDHTTFITSRLLDYTMVKVKDTYPEKKLNSWGALSLNPAIPKEGDLLTIIQHPKGRPQELAFSDEGNSVWEHRLHYKVSTEPGSSGSPVFDLDWNVVAIHHAGGNLRINTQGDTKLVNEGILFKYIQEDIDKRFKGEHTDLPENIEDEISGPLKTILVYNNKDAEYADGIYNHLFTQIRNGNLEIFDSQKDVPPDAEKETFLSKEFEKSSIILVLISRNLYSRQTLQLALKVEKYVSKKRVIPIRVSPFDLDGTPFAKLQGLPMQGKAISDFDDLDKILYEIVLAIIRVIKSILKI